MARSETYPRKGTRAVVKMRARQVTPSKWPPCHNQSSHSWRGPSPDLLRRSKPANQRGCGGLDLVGLPVTISIPTLDAMAGYRRSARAHSTTAAIDRDKSFPPKLRPTLMKTAEGEKGKRAPDSPNPRDPMIHTGRRDCCLFLHSHPWFARRRLTGEL